MMVVVLIIMWVAVGGEGERVIVVCKGRQETAQHSRGRKAYLPYNPDDARLLVIHQTMQKPLCLLACLGWTCHCMLAVEPFIT